MTTVVNCAPPDMPAAPGGGGGVGGATTPTPPSDYDPCPGGAGAIAYANVYGGLKLAVAAGNPCDGGETGLTPIPTNPAAAAIQSLIANLPITDYVQQQYLYNNTNVAVAIYNYLSTNGWTADNKGFASWAIGYLMGNRSISLEVFKNQFLGKIEARYGDFDEDYWNNPNISIPQQNLPTWANFSSNFPTHNKPNSVFANYAALLTALGGDVGDLYVPGGNPVNTCAIRVSYALVRSGVTIPNIPSRTANGKTYPAQTLKDKDGKYYFIRAKELNAWMRKTFGTNDGDPNTPSNTKHSKITKAQAGTNGANLPTLLSGKKGIYCLISDKPGWSSGHADLLYENATCGVECHFNGPIDWIDIWILQ